jgi:hypothetical protein
MIWLPVLVLGGVGFWWLLAQKPSSQHSTPTPIDDPPFPDTAQVQTSKKFVAQNPHQTVHWIVVTHGTLAGIPKNVFAVPHAPIGSELTAKNLFASLKVLGWSDFGVYVLRCYFDQGQLDMIVKGDMDVFNIGKCTDVWYQSTP